MARRASASITLYDLEDPTQIAEGTVYFTTPVFNAPGTPSASDYNFSTGAFTGLTDGWSRTPPTASIGGSEAQIYSTRYRATKETGETTATVTFLTPAADLIIANLITRGVQVFTARSVTDITTGNNATITVSAGDNAGLGNGDIVEVQGASVEDYNQSYTVTGTSGNTITTSTSTAGFSNFTGQADLVGDNINPQIDGEDLSGKGVILNNDGDLFAGDASGDYIFFDQSEGTFTISSDIIVDNIDSESLDGDKINPNSVLTNTVQVGSDDDNLPTISGTTLSGKGGILKSDGDFFIGDADGSHVFFDQSESELSVVGDIESGNFVSPVEEFETVNFTTRQSDITEINSDGEWLIRAFYSLDALGDSLNLNWSDGNGMHFFFHNNSLFSPTSFNRIRIEFDSDNWAEYATTGVGSVTYFDGEVSEIRLGALIGSKGSPTTSDNTLSITTSDVDNSDIVGWSLSSDGTSYIETLTTKTISGYNISTGDNPSLTKNIGGSAEQSNLTGFVNTAFEEAHPFNLLDGTVFGNLSEDVIAVRNGVVIGNSCDGSRTLDGVVALGGGSNTFLGTDIDENTSFTSSNSLFTTIISESDRSSSTTRTPILGSSTQGVPSQGTYSSWNDIVESTIYMQGTTSDGFEDLTFVSDSTFDLQFDFGSGNTVTATVQRPYITTVRVNVFFSYLFYCFKVIGVTSSSGTPPSSSTAGVTATTQTDLVYFPSLTNCTFVGYDSDWTGSSNITNSTAVGYNAEISASDQITLGNASVDSLRCNTSTISGVSDERDKTGFETLDYGLDTVNSITPYKFYNNFRNNYWSYDEEEDTWTFNQEDYSNGSLKGSKYEFGFKAQDFASYFGTSNNEIVELDTTRRGDEQYRLGMSQSGPIMWKAIQELSAKVDELQARLDQLEN